MGLGFWRAVRRSFARYGEFRGRAPRREFWWFVVFWQVAAALMIGMFGDDGLTLAALALLVPALASGARRLHDVGRPGWWLFLAVSWVGLVPLLWWWSRPGDPEANRFGEPEPLLPRASR